MQIIKLACTLLVLTTLNLCPILHIQAHEMDSAAIDAGRVSIPLATGWKFVFETKATQPPLDGEAWQEVAVPHSWNRVGYYNNTLVNHLHEPDNIDKREGIGWYQLTFPTPAHTENKRVWLEFDAASRTAEVWLNGVRLGEHRGGFTRFRFDATEAMNTAKPNTLLVKTDNTKPTATSSTGDVLPVAGDFFVHGGIYRPVRLVITDPVHIDMQDFGGPGVYARTTQLDKDRAEITVRSRVSNNNTQDQQVELSTALIDANGNTVAKQQRVLTLTPAQVTESTQVLTVTQPNLWQGVHNPYLYTLQTEVRSTDARLLDKITQPFGLRKIQIDPQLGFILNGEVYPLHGVAYHQDREGKGWAVSAADVAEDVQIMRDMGANTIRLAHYPHGQPVHELANRYGLILWDEIPLVTVWTYGSDHEKQNQALAANAKLQLREMIRQNFNNPSVAAWGIANEVDFGAVVPAFIGATAGNVPSPMPLLRELAAITKAEDSDRYSTLANCCEAVPSMAHADVPITAPAAEVSGLNRYFGWYYGEPEDLGPHLDKLHQTRPQQPMSVSEYGAGGAISLHTDNPLGGPVDSRGHDQPEGYMAYVHEVNWQQLAARPYLWATWIWNSFDFATTVRREGDAIDINTKGLVTYDRKIKKDPYFFYQANWNQSPTVHIAGRRYRDRAYPMTAVRVYSNAPITELVVNGNSYGRLSNCPDKTCVWQNVALQSGANKIEARGRFAKAEQVDTIEWQLAPELARSYHIDSGALIAAHSTDAVFGSDHFFKGGSAKSADTPGNWGKPAVLATIAGTKDRVLMTTYREGDFSYRLPVKNGAYQVTLMFMEPSKAAGERLFDVQANTQPLLKSFDIAREAGGIQTAITRTFTLNVMDGQITLAFKPVLGDALVSAIMIDPVKE